MAEVRRVTRSPEATTEFGRELAARLRAPVLLLLSGELGAGKTTLAKGIIGGLEAAREDDVTSPTFTLVHVFKRPVDGLKVYHVDLYRISGFADLESLGLEDALGESAIMIVEWPDKLTLRTNWPVIRVHLEHVPLVEDAHGRSEDECRQITISQSG
jgi:tRNA threonylcarbamoyladenosine biosynthesis protein TsaE